MGGSTGSEDVKVLFPDEAKDFIDSAGEGTFLLLDVRQPVEYEEGHLPGAELIPLPKLTDSLVKLDRDKPTLVYCSVGGRSAVAARLLVHEGFRNVYYLEGGMDAWEQPMAASPVGFHLEFARGDESPDEAIVLAYRMEQGLQDFHRKAGARTDDPELSGLMRRLADAEESHKKTLSKLFEKYHESETSTLEAADGVPSGMMEGGFDAAELMEKNQAFLKSVAGYLEITMMIESQALDLYLQMARGSSNETVRQVFFQIGDEEKAHLALLAKLTDEKVGRAPLV